MEVLRFPGKLRQCERAVALYRELPRQAGAQQRSSERDRGPPAGEHDLEPRQAGAPGQAALQVQQDLQADAGTSESGIAYIQAGRSARQHASSADRADAARCTTKSSSCSTCRRRFSFFLLAIRSADASRRAYASASAQERAARSLELTRGAVCSTGTEKCGSRAAQGCRADCPPLKRSDASSAAPH